MIKPLTAALALTCTLACVLPGCTTGGGGAVTPVAATPSGPEVALTVRAASFEPIDGWRLLEAPQTESGVVYVAGEPLLTEADVVAASVFDDDRGDAALRLDFRDDGARRLYDHSSAHLNQPLAVFIDHELVSVPNVTAAMSQSAVVAGAFDRFEANRIATALSR